MKLTVFVLLAASVAFSADDPCGWSNAKWGMTDTEILRVMNGQVQRFTEVDPYQKARVGIPSLEFAGIKFKVYMAPGPDDRLEHVLFTPVAQADHSDSTFAALEGLLIEKYGHPWKNSDDPDKTDCNGAFRPP